MSQGNQLVIPLNLFINIPDGGEWNIPDSSGIPDSGGIPDGSDEIGNIVCWLDRINVMF